MGQGDNHITLNLFLQKSGSSLGKLITIFIFEHILILIRKNAYPVLASYTKNAYLQSVMLFYDIRLSLPQKSTIYSKSDVS
jgi:hypothetical protein